MYRGSNTHEPNIYAHDPGSDALGLLLNRLKGRSRGQQPSRSDAHGHEGQFPVHTFSLSLVYFESKFKYMIHTLGRSK